MPYTHTPVMVSEVIEYLDCQTGKCYLDCTLGGAGHSKAILTKIDPHGILVAIDQDIDSINNAHQILAPFQSTIHLVNNNFSCIREISDELKILKYDGVVLDLGMSFHQIEASGRGFSFNRNELLDMRMHKENPLTAAEIVNSQSQEELERIFTEYGEERWAKSIARAIIRERKQKPIEMTFDLVQIIQKIIPKKIQMKRGIHPATLVFMALRIAVNNELAALQSFLNDIYELLNTGARICILSYHSLEDRIVKRHFVNLAKKCICPPRLPRCECRHTPKGKILTKKPKHPSEKEIEMNRMARSAKLRVFEKI